MRCRIGDVVRCGRVVSVDVAVEPAAVAAAVREERGPDDLIAVSCPEPSPLHDSVGCLRPEMGFRTKTALARAARTRGLATPYDDNLRTVREDLAERAVESVSLEAHREAIAEAESVVDQARVEAAEARGRLRERRETELGTAAAESRLEEALQNLSEAETAVIAARQEYERARDKRRERRDARERKRRLEDRLANLERQARAALVGQLCDEFRETLSTVPGTTTDAADDPFDADPVSAALAIARLGELSAPVILAVDRFESPERASEYLDAPVVRI